MRCGVPPCCCPAGGVCLAVAPGLHIAAAGQQQGGTPHRIPQIRRGQGPSTCYLQRTLVIDVLARQAPEKHCWTQGDPSCQISQAHSIRAARPEFRPVVKSGAERNERKVKRFSLKLSRKYAIIKPLPVSQDGTVQGGIEVVATSLTRNRHSQRHGKNPQILVPQWIAGFRKSAKNAKC